MPATSRCGRIAPFVNLQHVLERREAEIHRLRARVTAYEKDFQEMESRASD